MTANPTPDPSRLAAARSVARIYFERKRRWTKALFFIAAAAELLLFGSILFFFDFSDRFYWFVFFGLSFVYSPLITFIFRNSLMIDRMYYRLLLELKFNGVDHDGDEGGDEAEVRGFLVSRDRWIKWLLAAAGLFEASLWLGMLFFMDFGRQLDWFLFLGFMGIYTPLIIAAWRNSFAVDRTYYGLVDELKYQGGCTVEPGSAGPTTGEEVDHDQ